MGGGSGLSGGATRLMQVTPITTDNNNDPPKEQQQQQQQHVPVGLRNVGNTCYANAALQCLLSTALSHALLDPKSVTVFRRYSSNSNLLEKTRRSSSPPKDETQARRESCRWLTKELTRITRQYNTQENNSSSSTASPTFFGLTSNDNKNDSSSVVVDPGNITKHPNRLSKCLVPYQQEDAHEFLRALLGTLMMNGQNKKLSSLFDGLLESAITCQSCQHTSLTRDRYMDLSLDIASSSNLNEALEEFTKTELLSGENKVYCGVCQCKQDVTKGLRLATAPSILVCHLKRFAYDKFGRMVRLNKHVEFPLSLHIGNYMSLANKARPPPYELVGVLVHQGVSCECGHYLAYVKHGKEWFKCNDSVVTRVSETVVLQQQAYILMYEVAEMRSRHGYSQQVLAKKAQLRTIHSQEQKQQQEQEQEKGFLSFLCDAAATINEEIVKDICCGTSCAEKVEEEEEEEPTTDLDDAATLGDSTMSTLDTLDSSETATKRPFTKSASSSNLRAMEKEATHAYRSELASPPRRRRGRSMCRPSSEGGIAKLQKERKARSWKESSKSPRLRREEGRIPSEERPPRSSSGRQRGRSCQ